MVARQMIVQFVALSSRAVPPKLLPIRAKEAGSVSFGTGFPRSSSLRNDDGVSGTAQVVHCDAPFWQDCG